MQCSMIPKVTYLDSYEIVMAQRKAVFDKIYAITNSNKIYPGISDLPREPIDIPGLVEAGYSKNSKQTAIKPKSPIYTLLKKVVAEAMNHAHSWPFLNPVAGVPDYYDVIKSPMGSRLLV
jgi:histone acetyltransferase